MLIGQLLRPFGYLAIRHPYKWVVDWIYPGLLATLTCILLAWTNDTTKVTGTDGVISLTLSFIQSLPGFYIAALAAIATFGRADIDNVLPAPTPKIKIKFRDKENLVELTRRRFLAMLFAFLTGESIILILYSILTITYADNISSLAIATKISGELLLGLIIYIYFLLLFQMITATFWGLYYLGYKLHE